MLGTTLHSDIRRKTCAEPMGQISTDDLCAHVDLIFRNAGIRASRQKVSRLVRMYRRNVEPNGFALMDFLANHVQMTSLQRAIAADELTKVVAYADPTGETAVRNVMRGA